MRFITLTHHTGTKMQFRADRIVAIVGDKAFRADNPSMDRSIKSAVTVEFAGVYHVRETVEVVTALIEGSAPANED